MASKKRQRKRENSEEQRKQRRRRSLEILTSLDLWGMLTRTNLKDRFLDLHYPIPSLSLSSSISATKASREIIRLATKAIRSSHFESPFLGKKFLAVDYFATVKPILDLLGSIVIRDKEFTAELETAKKRTADLSAAETAATALLTMVRDIDDVLIQFGRIDERLYFTGHEMGWNENKKWFVRFVIHHVPAGAKRVELDGSQRTVFRCGQPYGLAGIQWIEWDGSIIGKAEGKKYRVFVQSHALDKLYRKEGRALFIENGEWLVHDYLWQSLRVPTIVSSKENCDEFLVEYMLNIHKLGYLRCKVVEDIVVVQTFLFLTMDGTPEGNQLWNRLRLRKIEKMHLGLDRIETFLQTDIQHDVELRKLLEECGCGHLFSILRTPISRERCVAGYANDMRTYLRLGN